MNSKQQHWINIILDYIYPSNCHLCLEALKERKGLCAPCSDSLKKIDPPFCKICSKPFSGKIQTSFVCQDCSNHQFHFEFNRSALQNSLENRQLIHELKYRGRWDLAAVLIEDMSLSLQQSSEFTPSNSIIIPVPLHWWRHYRRGFNQSAILAKGISKQLNIPYHELLVRKKHTKTQTNLNKKQRQRNLLNAFECISKKIFSENVILIDDVFTTGSTVDACCNVLKKHHFCEKIIVLTTLRG